MLDADTMDYYEILGVSKDSDQDEIKKAYRKLALEKHPDSSGGEDSEFKKINEAYETLSDTEKKRMYDSGGNHFDQSMMWGNSPFSSIFNNRSRTRGPMPSRGSNILLEIDITIEEVVEPDISKTVSYTRKTRCKTCNNTGLMPGRNRTPCKTCKGTGQFIKRSSNDNVVIQQIFNCPICHSSGQSIADEDECDDCSGTGQVTEERKTEIKIPRPIKDGQLLAFQGQGSCGVNGGPNGVLAVKVNILEHEIFEIDSDTVILHLPITLPQAVLGCTVEVPTVYQNTIEIKVPKGTKHGDFIKMAGYGCPFFGETKGYMVIVFDVSIPDKLSKECKKMMENMKKLWPEADNDSIKDYIDMVRRRNVQEKDIFE